MNNSRIPNQEDYIDIVAVAELLLRRAPTLLLSALLAGALTYFCTLLLITPLYRSSITMYVNNSTSKNNSDTISQSDLKASAQLVDTYSAVIKSWEVLEEVIKQADLTMSADKLQKQISTSAINETEVFKVYVVDPDPETAAAVANAIAEVAPDEIASIVEGSSVKIIDHARVPNRIDSPNYQRNTVLGAIGGMILTAGVIIIRWMLDTTVKTEEDFAEWKYPIFCTIPDMSQHGNSRGYYGYGKGKSERSNNHGTTSKKTQAKKSK